jgi:uncharacterized protein (TIGR02996 family)
VPGLSITLIDQRIDPPVRPILDGDVVSYLDELSAGWTPLHASPIRLSGRMPYAARLGAREITVELALRWVDEDGDELVCFTNATGDGRIGAHRDALAREVARALGRWARANGVPARVRHARGLRVVLSLWHPEPRFTQASKDRLDSPEAVQLVERVIRDELDAWLARHPDDARAIVTHTTATHRPTRRLAARALAAPTDGAAALVYADLLLTVGDPRGEVIALEHALAGEHDPAARLALGDRLVALVESQRRRIWGRPGGFPLRERWHGRSYITYSGEHPARTRPTELLRVIRFISQLTDGRGPSELSAPRDRELDEQLQSLDFEPYTAGRDRACWRRSAAATARIHDEIARLVAARPKEQIELDYEFRLASPSGPLLPLQARSVYAITYRLTSSLRIVLGRSPSLRLHLTLPFERADDELVRYCEAIETLLKLRLPRAGFHRFAPSVDGDHMEGQRLRWRTRT